MERGDRCLRRKTELFGKLSLLSTYLGAGGNEEGFGIALDSNGNAWIAGGTSSTNFPVVSGFQTSYGGGSQDVFITQLNSSGSAPLYSTYWGGGSTDYGFALAVDRTNTVYVSGVTLSTNIPMFNAIQATFRGGDRDAVLLKLAKPEPLRPRTRRRP